MGLVHLARLPTGGAHQPLTEDESTMGNWNITIEGVGPHGNHLTHGGAPFDAEAAAARAVRDLVEHGHNVTHAMVHAGGGRTELQLVKELGAIGRSDGHPPSALVFTGDALAEHLRATFKAGLGDPAVPWAEVGEAERSAWRAVAKAARL